MKWLDYSTANCTIQRSLDIIGEKWTILVLREAFNGVRRFDQIRDHIGVSDSVLTDRLRTLTSAGVLETHSYREAGHRSRKEYTLTEKGRELYPVLISLLNWGDRYCTDSLGPPIEVTHRDCGAPLQAVVQCTKGHIAQTPSDSQTAPGPGARQRDQPYGTPSQ